MSSFPEHDLHVGTRVGLKENRPEELAAARRAVAMASLDVHDRARLLEMLGLVPDGMELKVAVP